MAKEKVKVYENEVKKDIKFPRLLNYEEILYTPEKLEDINKNEAETAITGGSRALTGLDTSGNLIKDVINTKLDTYTKQILADYTFGASGAIKILGTGSAGVWISPTGILGKNIVGDTTFSLSASDGNAVFRGTVYAEAGVVAGNIVSSGINASNITTGTLTGRTVQTKNTGARVVMGGGVEWIRMYDDVENYVQLFSSGGGIWVRGSAVDSAILLQPGSSGHTTFYRGTTLLGTIGENFLMDVSGIHRLQIGGITRLLLNASGAELGAGAGTTSVKLWAGGGAAFRQVNLLSGEYTYPSLEPFSGPLDLGNPNFKWRHLYLSGTFYGGEISTTYTCYFGTIWTYSHQPRADNSYDLGGTTNAWRSLFLSEGGIITTRLRGATYPSMKLTSIGTNYTRADCRMDIVPDTSNQGSVGYLDRYWEYGWFNNLRYKSLNSFQNHDDIALIKKIKPVVEKDNKGREQLVWDIKSAPKEISENGLWNVGAVDGFLIGTLKQLVEKVENLEIKLGQNDENNQKNSK